MDTEQIVEFNHNTLSLNNTLHDHITKRPVIHHRPYSCIEHRITIHTAPVQRKAIMQRHTPYQLTDASAVALTERVNDIQLGHDIGQMLDLAFPVRFVKHFLAMQLGKHLVKLLTDQVRRIEHGITFADLLTTNMTCKWVDVLEQKTVDIHKLRLGESPLDRGFHQHILFEGGNLLLRPFQFVSVPDIQLIFQHIRIRIALFLSLSSFFTLSFVIKAIFYSPLISEIRWFSLHSLISHSQTTMTFQPFSFICS